MSDVFRGHEIYKKGEAWYFSDTGEPVAETWEARPCGHCGLMNTEEGYDGCLGFIPGALNACCGHGEEPCAYIQFPEREIRGARVKEFLEKKNSKGV